MKNLFERLTSDNPWFVRGSFEKSPIYVQKKGNEITQKNNSYEIISNYNKDENCVYDYSGSIENISDKDFNIFSLKTSFSLIADNLEVYTQYNGWQNESMGGWQPLITGTSIKTRSIRTSLGAAPFLAIWNNQTNRGIAFHLLPEFAWEMNVHYVYTEGENRIAEISIGINDEDLVYCLKSGEKLDMPHIIFYEFKNKTDMDCYKLHAFCNKNFKRKRMPVIYNSWLARFDNITYENLTNQIENARFIGVDYFVIDAGWFGKGKDWNISRGDWIENDNGNLCGKMNEIAQIVRKNNMKFGLWFEIESATPQSDIVNEHPDYFILMNDLYFYDFTNPKAFNSLMDVLSFNIEKYGIEFIKLDFNQDSFEDNSHTEYIDYYIHYRKFIRSLKEKYPNIYFENCASGGQRMDLSNCTDFNSFWLSDNQSPYEGVRMIKEGILRLPPQCIERWACLFSSNSSIAKYETQETEKIISAHDATWDNVVGIQPSFLKGFFYGGPIGISFDLNGVSENQLNLLREFIKEYKTEREFLENAVCRIICDTENVIALQYSDISLKTISIIVFSYKLRQSKITICPILDNQKEYFLFDETLSGKQISENGITINSDGNYRANIIKLCCK